MNANIMETQIFHQMKNDLRGHIRSHKGLSLSKIYMNANIMKT